LLVPVALCTGLLDATDVASDKVSGVFAGVFFKPSPIPALPRSSSGIEDFRERPPTDARGLEGLPLIVLLPDFTFVVLGVFLIGVGDFSFMMEPGPGRESLEDVTLERRFTLLLAFKGVLSNFAGVGPFNVFSGPKDGLEDLKVFVDARKSMGTASPLYPALEPGRELTERIGGGIDMSC
jgi:hypothetical protein